MKIISLLIFATSFIHSVDYTITMDEIYNISGNDEINVIEGKYMPLRYAEYKLKFKDGSCLMMNKIYCDTKDLSIAETPKKMNIAFVKWIDEFTKDSAEGKLRKIENIKTGNEKFGFSTILTDKKYLTNNPPTGEYKYIKLVMLRTSIDSFISSIIMVNKLSMFEANDVVKLYDIHCK